MTIDAGAVEGSAEGLAALRGDAVAVRLDAADVLSLVVDVPGVVTRAAVARALAGRAPVALGRLYWGFEAGDDGRVRVAMAHRDRVDAVLAALRAEDVVPGAVIADGIVVTADVPAEQPAWLWLLVVVPLLTGVGGWVLSRAGEARIARLAPLAGARAADVAAQAGAVAVFARPGVSEVLGRLDEVLPAGATLHAAGMGAGGAVEVVIDTTDPVVLRDSLGRDAMLRRARTVSQEMVADRGIRMTMRIDRP
ncbi:hypothetical protein [Sphingomonas prati]|uniref:GspL cytoplasmic actin-ATPase-like domain-containing protein n=1 Tax=Sphingomonas prati TaxID=1843237 RepID=A0A7W9BPP2_9SPHN|nr:hypothetical protein [Sphingomonas prati]MBB5727674.1 hypothetical protein [Sphingomonas prati]GGE79827.1 hypothetical protein GCM10011404_10670 [Sphingomonas prati]